MDKRVGHWDYMAAVEPILYIFFLITTRSDQNKKLKEEKGD